MSLVTFIKDYFEIAINDFLSVDTVNTTTVQEIISHLGQYLWTNSGRFFYYLISFEWFRDNVFLPVQIPTDVASKIGSTFLQEENHITFLEIGSGKNNIFFIFFVGFFNSFFLSLPFSCSHFISLRRLMIQGIPSGIYAGFGTVFGQFFFVLSFFSGFRFLLTSWLTFEPYNYFLGIYLIVSIVFDMVHQRSLALIKGSEKKTLIKIFFLNFFLAWVEQSCFNEFLSNVTLMKEPSIFEMLARQTAFQFNLVQWSYVLGILVGSIFFTCFFGWGFYSLFHYCVRLFAASYSRWIPRLNSCLLVLILGITLNSYCDYGADYILTAPLGFISEDKALKKTVFYPFDYNFKDPILVDADSYGSGKKRKKTSPLDFDVATFDKGFYLRPSTGWKIPFENLTFSAENAWTNKRDYDANTWMERFKESRSQKNIKKAVEFLLEKGKVSQKLGRQDEPKNFISQKKEFQFMPTDTSESSFINDLFFKQNFEEKSLTKAKQLQVKNFEDFFQTLSPKDFEKEVKKEKNFSLVELTRNEQDTILQRLTYENQKLNVNPVNLKDVPENEEEFVQSEKNTLNLKNSRTKKNFQFQKTTAPLNDYYRLKDLSLLDNLWKEEYTGEIETNESDGREKENEYSFDEFYSEEKKKKQTLLFDAALKNYSQRAKDMFKFGTKPFREHFFYRSTNNMQENLYKKFYYSNPIFKIFLNLDVDSFLNRQPKKYQLTPSQENLLFQKRQVLQNYYESLYQYLTLLDDPHNVRNLLKLNDIASLLQKQLHFYSVASKSYSNRVYNQQFKGTYHVVRRLFAITPESQYRSLKYDQPLFTDQNKIENLHFLHEDLLDEECQNENEFLNTNPFKQINPYLEKTDPIPLYSGWDSEVRRFVITTRFKSRSSTGIKITLPTEQEMKMYSTLSKILPNKEINETTRFIYFTQWPLTKKFLAFPKSQVDIRYETLFDSKFDPIHNTSRRIVAFGFFSEPIDEDDREPWEYTRVPTNVTEGVRSGTPKSYSDRVPPPRGGGFIWPGYHLLPKTVKETLHTLSLQNLTQKLNLKQIFTKKTTK